MKLYEVCVCIAAMAGAAFGQPAAPPPKVALVNMQEAITSTADGKNAEKRLDDEFTPRKAKLDAQEKEIAALQAQIDKGGLSQDAKEKLGQDIDHKTLMLKIATENADGDLRQAQEKVLKDLAPKMIACIAQYAKSQGFAMVFDISETDVPKLYPNTVDITKQVVAEYEKKGR